MRARGRARLRRGIHFTLGPGGARSVYARAELDGSSCAARSVRPPTPPPQAAALEERRTALGPGAATDVRRSRSAAAGADRSSPPIATCPATATRSEDAGAAGDRRTSTSRLMPAAHDAREGWEALAIFGPAAATIAMRCRIGWPAPLARAGFARRDQTWWARRLGPRRHPCHEAGRETVPLPGVGAVCT